jgi:hypothetical protein
MNGRSERDQHHSDFQQCKIVESIEERPENRQVKKRLQEQ